MSRDELSALFGEGPRLPWDLRPVLRLDPPAPSVDVAWQLRGGDTVHVEIRNDGLVPLRLERLELVAELDLPAVGGWFWIQGRYMQMDTLVRAFGAPPEQGFDGRYRKPVEGGVRYVSRELAVLSLPGQPAPCLLIGSLDPTRFFTDLAVDVDEEERRLRTLRVMVSLEGTQLAPGERLVLPELLILTGDDGWELAERYADRVASRLRARRRAAAPTAWCSWYELYGDVSEAAVLANLDVIVRRRLPIDVVQIDDGYQSVTGDWLVPNAKFPSGMAALARRIREAGKTPGLWLAPLVVAEGSSTYREDADALLRTPDGHPYLVDTWLGRCAVLDVTTPAGAARLAAVIRAAVHEWGYPYLKLDALAFAAVPAGRVRYHEPGTTALSHLRRALEIIRDAAGDEAFLLACTCHFGPAIGLVDAMRVGPDTAARWAQGTEPSVKRALQLSLLRGWMHRRWWWNDPDSLVVRDQGSTLTAAELRAQVAGIALAGGLTSAGDDLSRLSREREELVRFLMPPTGVAARPLDLSDAPVPRIWRARLDAERSLVSVIQWDDAPAWVVPEEILAPGEIAYDPLRREVVGKGDVLLEPHDAALWQTASPGPTPRVVGDSGHVAFARLAHEQVSGRLRVRNESGGSRTVAIESRGRILEVEIPPRRRYWFD